MNYDRDNLYRREDELNSRAKRRANKLGLTIRNLILIAVIGAFAIAICVGVGAFRGILDTAPDVSNIDVTPTGFSTFVYDSEGNQTAKLVSTDSNRIPVTFDQIPVNLQHAFVAIEDERFYDHRGIDIQGIIRAGIRGLSTGNFDQGASTITQQLIKNNVFTGWTSETFSEAVRRKIQEQYLAVEVEKTMSKDDILLNYLNTINLGHNTLGVQAASLRYFGKDVSDLNLSEAAVIAGITQNPTKYDPITFPENNNARRKLVLSNMLTQGYIDEDEYDSAVSDNVYTRIQTVDDQTDDNKIQSYFVDALTDQVLEDLQSHGYTEPQAYTLLYSGGLKIYSTQDPAIQAIADEEVANPDNYPYDTKWYLDYSLSVQHADGSVDNFSTEMLKAYFKETNPYFTLVFPSEDKAKEVYEEYKTAVMKEGDTVLSEKVNLQPQPQISFTIEDQHTGNVVAMVGGRGTKAANRTLNRAYHTYRQPGSTFKIVSTYAPALDAGGFTLASTQDDAPFTYEDGVTPVRNWYGENYRGLSSVRLGIQNSMNIVAVKTLTDITPELGYEYLLDFGFTSLVKELDVNNKVFSDIQQPLALGGLTKGITNFELNAAYSTIANGGEYLEPKMYTKITDHDNNVILDSSDRETRRVLKETTAWLLTSAMEDVVTKGTGTYVNFGTTPIAGKTGTTSDENDVWFCGYTNYYCATAWAGYDENTDLVGSESGLAKTIWRAVMERVHEGKPASEFTKPAGIVQKTVCRASGKLPIPGVCSSDLVTEYFDENMVPTEPCDIHGSTVYCSVTGLPADDECPFQQTGRIHNASNGVKCPHTRAFMAQDNIDTIIAEEKAQMISRRQKGSGYEVATAWTAGSGYGTQSAAPEGPTADVASEADSAVAAANANLYDAASTLKAVQDALTAAQQSGDEAAIKAWSDAVNTATGSYSQAVEQQQAAAAAQQAAQNAAAAQQAAGQPAAGQPAAGQAVVQPQDPAAQAAADAAAQQAADAAAQAAAQVAADAAAQQAAQAAAAQAAAQQAADAAAQAAAQQAAAQPPAPQ